MTQGQSEADWLAANPYVAPTPTADQVADEAEKQEIRDLAPKVDTLTTQEKDDLLKVLLKREARRVN